MKELLLIICLAFAFSSCILNKQNTSYVVSDAYDNAYDSYLEEGETKVFSWYQGVSSTKDEEAYILRLFYPEKKQLTFLKTYKYKNRGILHGRFVSWADNGNKMSEGNYKDNLKDGEWAFYDYEDGFISSKGTYYNEKKQGLWKEYMPSGLVDSEINWEDGLKEGIFIEYDSLGNKMNEGIYKADTIFQQSAPREQPLYFNGSFFTAIDELPYLKEFEQISDIHERRKKSDNGLLKYIYGMIHYPPFPRENATEGLAIISFTITEDGSIKNIYAISGVCEGIEEECIRIAKNMPPWNPGKKRGKAVSVKYNLPIRFKLN
jgi:antitoxin component YwqK of YwqJK toxin-antitoxin module